MQIIHKYFPELSQRQVEQLEALEALYSDWNSKINVISRKDIEKLYERHILHSLAIAKFTRFSSASKIMDVGTGGGFPGIPLAIMFPDCNFLLVDSIAKKIKVVNEISSAINLTNVKTMHDRAENVKEKFDFVISRAVTAFPQFVAFVKNNISTEQKGEIANGIIYLKGGDLNNELDQFKKTVMVYELSKMFDEEFFETKKIVYLPF